MPILACDLGSLVKNSACFNCFTQLQNQAAIVYFSEQRFAAFNKSTPRSPNTLRQLAACISCTRPDFVADQLDVAVAQEGAILAGAALSSQTLQQISQAMNPFLNMNLTDLRAIEILIRCGLQSF